MSASICIQRENGICYRRAFLESRLQAETRYLLLLPVVNGPIPLDHLLPQLVEEDDLEDGPDDPRASERHANKVSVLEAKAVGADGETEVVLFAWS